MNVQVVYCNHQTADLSVRERLAFSSEDQLHSAYQKLLEDHPESEIVVLSTCNRIELYAAQQDPAKALSQQEIAAFYSDFHKIPTDEFVDDLFEQRGPDAVRHLFKVVSSIDSMVLGEPQIVSQVKDAYRIATENNACGPLTNVLFQRAIGVSSRVRSETKLAEGRVSIASVAVGEFGRRIFTRFDDKTVLIIGAGEMAEETLRYLKTDGVGKIVVVNRSFERAEQLATEWGGTARPIEELNAAMSDADVIVSTTGADKPIVNRARFTAVRIISGTRPVFILDLGAPRDFTPDVASIDDNVFLYDIDDLEVTCARNRKLRESELLKAEKIIDEETDNFMHDIYHRATGPIIKRLRQQWHDISRAELDILFKRLPDIDDKDRKSIEKSIERIVNKLLHPPLETLKDEARAGTPHGLLDAIKHLFKLRD
jgi:glutamyl-tRNA reductase